MPALPDRMIARVMISADLVGGEQMTHSFHLVKRSETDFTTEAISSADAETVAPALAAAWSTSALARQSSFSSTTQWQRLALYVLGTDGRAVQVVEAPMPDVTKGTATNVLPSEVALAVTLRTARAGRSHRGRVFMGGFGVDTVNPSTGRVKPDYAAEIAAVPAVFLQSCNDLNYPAVIYSRVHGTFEAVRSVDVGDVFDVQRRRRDSLREIRSAVPADLPGI